MTEDPLDNKTEFQISVMKIAANLMTQDDTNPEYDRACVEIVTDVIGLSSDDRDVVERILRRFQC